MPWTFAHPAAILPLRRVGLPFSALVAGSIAPDVPSYVPGLSIRGWTHDWIGVVSIDLVIALALVALWNYVLRDVFAARLDWPRSRLTPREWLLAVPASLVGSATHVVWDAATHRDEWITDRVAWLQEQHGPLLGYEWGQLVSTVVGGLVVGVYVFRRRSR